MPLMKILHNMKTTTVDIKMDISLFKIRCTGFPQPCIRMELLNCPPNCFPNTSALETVLHIKKIQVAAPCGIIYDNDRTANYFFVCDSFIGNSTFLH